MKFEVVVNLNIWNVTVLYVFIIMLLRLNIHHDEAELQLAMLE